MLTTAFDIEYDFSAKEITSFGHWSSNGTRGEVDVQVLMEILNVSAVTVIICLNILQHDLPVQKKKLIYAPKALHVLDTLYLCIMPHLSPPSITAVNPEGVSFAAINKNLTPPTKRAP